MSKTKTPFFGLRAHGSVGGSITAQGLPKETLIRTKPLPTYRFTLAQAYQRWLYEDYAYRWRQQSDAVKTQHRTAGVPYHLTAFQYWMKYNLTNLPDINGWWKLDDNLGPTVQDSSRNNNPGTIVGASPAVGPIDNALYFDGLNDRLTIPNTSFIAVATQDFSLEFWIQSSDLGQHWFDKRLAVGGDGYTGWQNADGTLRLRLTSGGVSRDTSTLTPIADGGWHHVVYTCDRDALCQAYTDGVPDGSTNIAAVPDITNTDELRLMMRTDGNYPMDGYLDNWIIWGRVLDATEVLRHSERRYPP